MHNGAVPAGADAAEFSMRHDWNSLLSPPSTRHGDEPPMLFRNFSTAYFPPADALLEYLADFAQRQHLRIRFGTTVTTVQRLPATATRSWLPAPPAALSSPATPRVQSSAGAMGPKPFERQRHCEVSRNLVLASGDMNAISTISDRVLLFEALAHTVSGVGDTQAACKRGASPAKTCASMVRGP